ncbi:MAG: TonB-dependent receptor, partial [Bacteroidota bacterium]
LGYDQQFGSNFRLKLESYIQFLDNVPVDPFPSSFSLLNAGADFVLPGNTYLVNEGTGRNVGIELTLEKFFSQNYYLLFTTSIFDSKYTGSDNVTRNTTFNGQYVVNALAGKEFPIGKSGRYTATIDWKMTLAGGRYVIPIDLEASIAQGREVLQNELAFSEQLSDYFRTDLKVGFRMNRQKFTQEFSVDIQNLTDRANVFSRSFNPSRGTISIENQLGLFVVPQYRILF